MILSLSVYILGKDTKVIVDSESHKIVLSIAVHGSTELSKHDPCEFFNGRIDTKTFC